MNKKIENQIMMMTGKQIKTMKAMKIDKIYLKILMGKKMKI